MFVVGRAPAHYRLLDFFCPETKGYMTTGTYKLYPTNCSMPAISKGDRTIIAAADLLDACKVTVPANGAAQQEYARVITQLTKILSGGTFFPNQRVFYVIRLG